MTIRKMASTTTEPTTTRPSTAKTTVRRRFEILLQLIETGLLRSRQALDTKQLVEASYGDDADLFGGTEMLVGTMDDMLDKVQEQVLHQDLPTYLQNNNIEGLLDRVEHLIEALDRQEAATAQVERDDQESALRALDTTLLPTGITLENLVDFHKYRTAMFQKEKLSKALEELQKEITTLENEQAERTRRVESQQQILIQSATEFDCSADSCSMAAS